MHLIRLENPDALEYIRPHIQIDDDVTPDQGIAYIRRLMEDDPTSLQIMIGFEHVPSVDNGEAPDWQVQAFSITVAFPQRDHVFLQQAFALPGTPEHDKATMFLHVVNFAQAWGRKSIRCETQRGKAIQRAWGFEEHTVVLKLDLPDDYSARLLTRAGVATKEPDNELRRRIIERDEDLREPEGNRPGHHEDAPGEGGQEGGGEPDREVSSAIRGDIDSGVAPGGPAGEGAPGSV